MKRLADKRYLVAAAGMVPLAIMIFFAMNRGSVDQSASSDRIRPSIKIVPIDAALITTNLTPADAVAVDSDAADSNPPEQPKPGEPASGEPEPTYHEDLVPRPNELMYTRTMYMAHCLAGTQIEDLQATGGYYRANNWAQPVTDELPGSDLFLVAQPEVKTYFRSRRGMQLLLVNRSGETRCFDAADSRLNILQEAQDDVGNWHPIEFFMPVLCGNSCHHVYLKPGYYWAFNTAHYQGHFKTTLRFTLTLDDGSQIHSNEFDGSVNIGQFIDPFTIVN